MRTLFLLFITVPIIEMFILIQVGQWLGALPTIGLVLLTAVIGLHLLRQQGLATLLRANRKIESGGLPAKEMVEGILLAIGGALLLTPGFFTDAVGFACLLPVTRHALVTQLLKRGVFLAAQNPNAQFFHAEFHSQHRQGDEVIDAEFYHEETSRKDIDHDPRG